MGGGIYSKYDESFEGKDWEEITHSPDRIYEYVIVKNRITGQLLDRYVVQCANEQQYQKYMASINYRRNEENVVRIIHYEPKIIKQFCGSSYILNVYLQHCKSRLGEYQDIPSPDYLYCAVAMLNGFEKLYRKIGRFFISADSVMIDQAGKIRVWINENFAENQAEDIKQINGSRGEKNDEYQMVNDIITIILDNVDEENQEYRVKFKDFYLQKKQLFNGKVGFIECRNIINDFCRTTNITIPNIFNAVLNLYEKEKIQKLKNQKQFNNNANQLINIDNSMQGQGAAQNSRTAVVMNNGNRMVANSQINNPIPIGPIIRGTSLPIISKAGMSNTFPDISSYANNRNTMPIYPPSSHSGVRVAAPLSPLPLKSPPSPTHHIVHYPIHPTIQQQSLSHTFPTKIQPFPTNPLVLPPPLTTFVPMNQTIVKQNAPYKIPSTSSVQPKIVINQSCPLSLSSPSQLNKMFIKKEVEKSLREQEEKRNSQLGQQQLEIQKNFILKDNTNIHDQNIIEAHIIRELSQLHKIQQLEKQKQNTQSINYNNNNNTQYGLNHYLKQNKQQYQLYNQSDGFEHLFDNPLRHQPNITSIGNSSVQADSRFLQGQQRITFNKQQQQNQPYNHPSFTPITSKQPPQFYSWFTPRLSKHPQSQNQGGLTNYVENSPVNVNLTASAINRQFYYTLHDEIQLDPEIVNDISLYVQS